ncbi:MULTISPECIES: ABC transporter ATP-binding protein [Haloferax]|jgi:multiple sugar transport system ATP-binding protein|uniref:ABC-type D-xylose/L-arabinose transporter n=7 Tax=Haloferacaceae TaxID=1644056 RepID=A0A6C0UVX8_HALVO|nr:MULTISPECIES: ABC transporter ATP-binding protein [Haloferax]ELZ70617.1 putative sugar ABC transporter ATP-binding protein [Haloferax lucentense DSM 14919]ELZ92595.1 putative sugar ABC transporter ATP-binding protein [Haloferax alexandrinus JCM 10717]MBC9985337.1 ABC transporter ATP-binding protein [Haloferax sp. AS1]NLV01491.1 ATP-binding cassette domain-containing protein [Haloferax alexandrinus]QIB77118.1 ABC transporter ATP-binding protein [Haloferax alexandrinus]
MATLELDSITKTFQDGDDEIVAVDDISMSIDDGEFLVVVGPSGCGKSTTLRMIAGLETITSGTISLGDRVINDVASQDRDIAMVFQSYALYPHMTVRQNMSFGLEESTDLPDDEIGRMVSETADLLDIPSLLDRKPSDLSGGQQQRVALGRAIVRDPEVFLMDEPLSNLDAKLRAQMRTELQRLQDDLGVTTVYVTHDQTEAMTMGDRIAILDGGELQQIATPLECYHEPANQFVASFLGEPSMNFFDVTREGDRLVGDSFEYPVGAEIRDDIGDVTDLVLGIRPESVELVEAASGDHDFEMTVDVVEPMGDENTLYLYFEPDADPETAETLVATTDGLTRISPGETVVAQIPEEAIHLFDGRTGEALHNRSMEEAAQQIDLG